MKTPYIPHMFGEDVDRKLNSRRGWLTAGVASSIAWPILDVCITYATEEYFLRGSERNGAPAPPGITIACNPEGGADEAIAKIYRFTSILSWFQNGYVDVSGYISGSHPTLYGARTVYSTMGVAGAKSFNCNHMPLIEDDNVRKALAFWREGKRLDEVHDGYSFLSFYKVIESQFRDGKKKGQWISANIDKLTGRAAKRVAELRAAGVDVPTHLFESGRCAVAHAKLGGQTIDPDIPADKKRLSADLIIIEELARIFISDELGVPDARSLYRTRDRLAPWDPLMHSGALKELRTGYTPIDVSGLTGRSVSVGLWPDGPIPGLERMTMSIDTVNDGVVKTVLVNERNTILLVFYLDYKSGRVNTNLDESKLFYGSNRPNENDVRAYATFFYKVFGNGIAELTCDEMEPIDCEVVIPVNMYMTMSPERAIEEMVERFNKEQPQKI